MVFFTVDSHDPGLASILLKKRSFTEEQDFPEDKVPKCTVLRISQKLDFFAGLIRFFLALFLSYFSPLLLLLAFALHILSYSRKTFRIDYL